jgi:hypothetical protein
MKREFIVAIKNKFVWAIGISLSVFGVLQFFGLDFSQISEQNSVKVCFFIGFIIVVLICVIVYTFLISKRRRDAKFTITIHKHLKIQVMKGDIFDCSDNIVIPVNDYFDTIVDGELIKEGSVHGQYIKKYFNGKIEELDTLINEATMNIGIKANINETRLFGKKQRYPIGSAIRIKHDNKYFFLVVASEFDSDNRATIKDEQYVEMLNKLLTFVHQKAQGNTVNIPMMGTGQSNATTGDEFFDILYKLLKIRKDVKILGGISIIVYDKSDVNLWEVRQALK